MYEAVNHSERSATGFYILWYMIFWRNQFWLICWLFCIDELHSVQKVAAVFILYTDIPAKGENPNELILVHTQNGSKHNVGFTGLDAHTITPQPDQGQECVLLMW